MHNGGEIGNYQDLLPWILPPAEKTDYARIRVPEINPLKSLRRKVQFMEGRLGSDQEVQVPHPGLHSAVCRIGQKVPVQALFMIPLVPLGEISSHKGITFTASAYRAENLSEKDRSILEVTRGLAWVRYAISYVRDAAEMARYRALIQPAYLIAKLERGPAMIEAQQVAEFADELWLCRGDLGAEVGLVDMAAATRHFSALVPELPVPAIMAGQVLEHMTDQPVPTRSEVCYLHDTLAAGYRGFVLSDEAAVGRYPVESCRAAALFRD